MRGGYLQEELKILTLMVDFLQGIPHVLNLELGKYRKEP
jgi:hypothetical protein